MTCFVAGEFPLLDAGIEPIASVARARVYFKGAAGTSFYYVEMSQETGRYFGKLPRPRVEASPITYYVQSTTTEFDESQTREIEAIVVKDKVECGDRKVAAFGPAGPVTVFSASTGASILAPAGFAAAAATGLAVGVVTVIASGAAVAGIVGGIGRARAPEAEGRRRRRSSSSPRRSRCRRRCPRSRRRRRHPGRALPVDRRAYRQVIVFWRLSPLPAVTVTAVDQEVVPSRHEPAASATSARCWGAISRARGGTGPPLPAPLTVVPTVTPATPDRLLALVDDVGAQRPGVPGLDAGGRGHLELDAAQEVGGLAQVGVAGVEAGEVGRLVLLRLRGLDRGLAGHETPPGEVPTPHRVGAQARRLGVAGVDAQRAVEV